MVADATGNVIFWNRAAEHFFGHTDDEIAGRPLSLLLPERLRQPHEADLQRLASGGSAHVTGRTQELTGLHRDGRTFPIELSLWTWESQGRRLFSAMIRDLSTRKAAEESARAQEERLRQATRLDAIGSLAGGIAHDFNNILTVIFGHADLLTDGLPAGSRLLEHVTLIREAGERAAGMTRHLLAFGRKQLLHVATIDVNELVDALVIAHAPLIPPSIQVELRLHPGLPTVTADRTQIEQVILDLIASALEAMAGGGRLMIETSAVGLDNNSGGVRHGATSGPQVAIAVIDTGAGMDAATRARVFDPFFARTGRGRAGLGLATAYGIVKQSGGDLVVDSEPGTGTTFTVYLPAAAEHVVDPPAQTIPRKHGSVVLVVEDEQAIRRLNVNLLRREGYSVVEAGSAEEALLLDPGILSQIDLMVTDVVLPGKNGRELAEALAPSSPAMRVLFVSGYSEDAIGHDGVLDEGIAFLPKPFPPSVLLDRVRQMLAPTSGSRTPRSTAPDAT